MLKNILASTESRQQRRVLEEEFADAEQSQQIESRTKISLLSMSRFSPSDHYDCILATEHVTRLRGQKSGQNSVQSSKHQSLPYQHHQSPYQQPHYHSLSYLQNQQSYHQQAYYFQNRSLPPPPCAEPQCSSTDANQPVNSDNIPVSARTIINESVPVHRQILAYMSHHRRLFSVLCALTLFCVACLLSTSIVDVLTERSEEALDYDNPTGNRGREVAPISLEEIIGNDLRPAKINATWISDTELTYYDIERNFVKYDATSGQVKKLIHFVESLTKNLVGSELSADQKYLLNPTDTQQRYRFSHKSKIKIYDIRNQSLIELFEDDKFHNVHFELAQWGPMGSQLVFSLHNDLYYKHSVHSDAIRLSVTGVPGTVFNGQLDWLYEEDVMHAGAGAWFSPEGTDLTYIMINSSDVHNYAWTTSGRGESLSGEQYPVEQTIKYPKPGTPNPKATLYVVDLNEDIEQIRVRQLQPPKTFTHSDYYINHVSWYDNNAVLVSFLPREQTSMMLALCERYNNFRCRELYSEKSSEMWISPDVSFASAPKVSLVMMRTPAKFNEELGEFFQIARINVKSKTKDYLTKSPADVLAIEHYSPITNDLFYSTTLPGQPEVKHIFRRSLETTSTEPECMTCELGNSCLYNQIKFNPSGTRFLLNCQGFEIPKIELREVKNNRKLLTWTDNAHILAKLVHRHIPRYEKLNVTLPFGGEAILELILPHNFDESQAYPLLLQLYNAPDTQQIVDQYQMDHWSSHLASQEQFIYARVDVRGSAGQGLRHMKPLYKRLGGPEIDDILAIVRFMKRDLHYVDPRKIAVWGWSYGGYAVLMSLIRQQENEFACGAAVAPVTNWMLYDTAYSERYLGSVLERDPEELTPYLSASILNRIESLRGKKFMLVFGTSDNNVHAQHSYRLMMKLNDADIEYDAQIYPDDDHTLGKNNIHLYKRLAKYFKGCFNGTTTKTG